MQTAVFLLGFGASNALERAVHLIFQTDRFGHTWLRESAKEIFLLACK